MCSISGPGTGLLLSSFLSDGSVAINLGSRSRLEPDEMFPLITYIEEYFAAGSPHLRALYYDRCSFPEVTAQELTKLIHQADTLASSCFETSDVGYNSNINKSPIGRAYTQVFNTMINGSQSIPRYFYDTQVGDCDWAEELILETPSCITAVDTYGWDQAKYRQALQQSLNDNKLDFQQCRKPAKSQHCTDRDCVFTQIKVQVDVKQDCIAYGDGQGNKAVFKMEKLYSDKECVVIAGGISTDYQQENYFEKELSNKCKAVYAFDCTIQDDTAKMAADGVDFSPVCIGSGSVHGKIGDVYIDQVLLEKNETRDKSEATSYAFKSLLQLTRERKLRRVDLLKIDIEGHEWEILENELTKVWKEDESLLPDQIAFELHSKYANPAYVPQEVVGDKGRDEVNNLFLLLSEMGYYVISKDINEGDPACCEFVVARLNPKATSTLRNRLAHHGCELKRHWE